MKKEMVIEGMHCGHCQARVEKALSEVAGVESVKVNFVERGRLINTSSLFKNRLQHTLGSNVGENLFFPGGNRIKNRNGFGGIHYLVIQGNIVGDSLAVFFVEKTIKGLKVWCGDLFNAFADFNFGQIAAVAVLNGR